MMRKKKLNSGKMTVHFLLLVLCAISAYPILLILFNAISSESTILEHGYVWWPKELSFAAFRELILRPGRLANATAVTVLHAIVGGSINVFCNAICGYVISQKDYKYKKQVETFFILSRFIPGGSVIASYIINVNILHLDDNILAYLIMGAFDVMGMYFFRAFFKGIPSEIYESAKIDGAGELQTFVKITIPLSKTFILTQFFLELATRWREFSISAYYMSDPELQSLGNYMRNIMNDISILKEQAMALGMDASQLPVETMRFAVVFFTMIPVMCIFPFLQKYFEKGAVVGSVKG